MSTDLHSPWSGDLGDTVLHVSGGHVPEVHVRRALLYHSLTGVAPVSK